MGKLAIQIVSFDVPYPADYGGVIDVCNRIKSLHAAGVDIILHTFEYGRGKPKELKQWCKEVHYYPRKRKLLNLLSATPFIVKTRQSQRLSENLKKGPKLILLEGTHCAHYLFEPTLKNKAFLLRMHNREAVYYEQLALQTKSKLLKAFHFIEGKKLKQYEQKVLNTKVPVLSVNRDENNFFNQFTSSYFFPSWHGMVKAEESPKEPYVLYHGNLSVPENETAVLWLYEQVFKKNPTLQFKVAGKNPTQKVQQALKQLENVTLFANPDHNTMHELITKAQVHLLYTEQNVGIKLKLLQSVFSGGTVVGNHEMLQGSGLENCCIEANTPQELSEAIHQSINGENNVTGSIPPLYEDLYKTELLLKVMRSLL